MRATQQNGPRLLAIDDSTLIHRLVRVRLRSERIDIHSAQTGEQGLELATQLLPDVILLDIDLPDMNGYELLRRLKADSRTHDIPVIFLSASAETADKVRGLEMGAIDFIPKPFEMAELTARVRSAVQIRQLIKMLAERAQLDALTGLWNRAYFDERLKQEIADAKRYSTELSLIFCDLDNFKQLNDQRGHPFGDHVLREFSHLLSSRRSGDVPCRYGGEEFVIILPQTGAEEAAVLADRTRIALRELAWEGQSRLTVTASFGVADLKRLTSESPTAEALLRAADEALYEAKKAGRNRVRIAPLPNDNLRISA